jgi:hypothetical protein
MRNAAEIVDKDSILIITKITKIRKMFLFTINTNNQELDKVN